ncbi:hypothetical protein, partial [Faecalibaculum rodentium]|uniref:hypothetical protein n=1 Tax=Faecalibaculum rodentium TaxID=1702221 RepID=UPI0023F531B5
FFQSSVVPDWLVKFVSESRMREICTSGLIRGGCREAIAYFLVRLTTADCKHQGKVKREASVTLLPFEPE